MAAPLETGTTCEQVRTVYTKRVELHEKYAACLTDGAPFGAVL